MTNGIIFRKLTFHHFAIRPDEAFLFVRTKLGLDILLPTLSSNTVHPCLLPFVRTKREVSSGRRPTFFRSSGRECEGRPDESPLMRWTKNFDLPSFEPATWLLALTQQRLNRL